MSSCVFCRVIEGDLPSHTLFEDSQFKVILDAFPSGKGHTLVLLKEHVENVFELESAVIGKAHQLAGKVAQVLKDYLRCEGVNILQNNGTPAGQTVFHYHIHVIPRFTGDTVTIGWKTKTFEAEELKELSSALAKGL